MASKYRNTSMEEVVNIQRGQKKNVCTGLHEIMGGIGCSGHYCAIYSSIGEALKWWRKLFLVPRSMHCKFVHFILLS
jgi:hypothetical protein